jgi:uncharacterized protein (UPF0303 family)
LSDELEALLDEIQRERPMRTLNAFTHADARRLGGAAAAIAERDSLPVVISVVRGTQQAFHVGFAGTTAEHDDWVRRKINTTMRHEVPSLEVVVRHQLFGQQPVWLDPLEFAVAGGAVPIVVGGLTVGAIAVSGLVADMREDHDLAMDAFRILRLRATETPS